MNGTGSQTAAGRLLASISALGIASMGLLIGLGVPIGWLWIGSQFQGGTAPSWRATVLVQVGIVVTLMAFVCLASLLVARDRERARPNWLRSQSDGVHDSLSDVHPLEWVTIVAVAVDVVAFLVWFFLFADPGTPIGQG